MHLPSPNRFAALKAALPIFFAAALLTSTGQAQSAATAPKKPIAVEHGPSKGPLGLTPFELFDGRATLVSHYNPEQKLRLTLGLQPPHMAEEEKFLQELGTKGSPNFHKFLTQEEWNVRFAPSEADEQRVVDWAKSQGFTVTHRFNHRLLVDVEAPAGAIEKAFGVTINRYQVDREPDLKFSNDRDPAIPAFLGDILHNVEGLNNIQHDHGSRPDSAESHPADYAEGPAVARLENVHGDANPDLLPPEVAASLKAKGNRLPPSNYGPPITSGFLNPAGVYSSQVYNYDGLDNLGHCCNPHNDSGGSPNVSSIAIAAFGNYLNSDIGGFGAAYPYLAYNVDGYLIDGSIDCGSDPGDCPSGETAQDIQWSMATSNSFNSYLNTAHVWVYVGGNYNNSTFTDMYGYMLSDNLARVFTTSWSCTEVYGCSTGTMDDRHNILNNMVGAGWTIIAASGDRGSSDDCYFNKNSQTYNTAHESVAYPASDWDVLGAGGTQLQVYSDGSWDYEHGWQGGTYFGACGQNNGGSGGGISAYYGKPGWQSQYGGTKRLSPDISLNALGVGQNVYFNGSFGGSANGTSVVAPELAGFFAQENSYLNYIGHICGSGGADSCTPVGNPMPFFYPAAYYGSGYVSHYPFYDMTTGCNNNDVTAAQSLGSFCSHSSYDLVTGWGSANMLQLAWAINWYLIPSTGSSPSVDWTGGPATGTWYNTDQVVSWAIIDNGGGGFPSSGVAGFTQGWDSIPTDSFSQPHGGSAGSDAYYSGPQFANATDGCLAFAGASGCGGSPGEGCHTAHVRGWNNQGWTTGDQTYGPVCYDVTPPNINIGANPASPSGSGWYNIATGSPTITLSATDPNGSNGSGVKTIYGVLGPTTCAPNNLGNCQIYGGPFGVGQGSNPVTAFSEDNAGNFSSVGYTTFYVDTVAPVTTATYAGNWQGTYSASAVTVHLTPTDATSGVQTTYYILDGGSATVYSSPIMVSTVGPHTLKFWSVDFAGNTEAQHFATFTIKSTTTTALVATPNPTLLGWAVKMTATVTPALSGTPGGSVTFWNGATNLGAGTLSGGVATLTTMGLPVGKLTLQATYNAAGYYLTSNSFPFDITVRENTKTTVATSSNPSVYGQPVTFAATVAPTPTATGTPTGSVIFRAGSTVLGTGTLNGSGIASITTSALSGGSQSITAAYTSDALYLVSTSTALDEVVKPASQTITFTPPAQVTWGVAPITLTASASSGLGVKLQLISGPATLTGNVLKITGVGTVTVQATQAGNADYLAAGPVQATVHVNPAFLKVAAFNYTINYGGAVPSPLKYAIGGFVNGDTSSVVSGTPTVTTTAVKGSPAGTYPITPALGTLSASNYKFAFQNGTLTIDKVALVVTAGNDSITYGAAVPTSFQYTIAGFVNGDNIGVVSGKPSFSTTAVNGSPVGNYTITPAQGTLSAANYTFTFKNGVLTIGKASLKVTPLNYSVVYGGLLPAVFKYSFMGLVNGDTSSVVSGSPSITTAAAAGSPVGTYQIVPTLGTLSAANYTFTFADGTLTITKALLAVTPFNVTITQGAAIPSNFSYSITGFKNGDTKSVVSGAPSITTTATSTSPAGTYPITPALGTLSATNYTFVFHNGTLTIKM